MTHVNKKTAVRLQSVGEKLLDDRVAGDIKKKPYCFILPMLAKVANLKIRHHKKRILNRFIICENMRLLLMSKCSSQFMHLH